MKNDRPIYSKRDLREVNLIESFLPEPENKQINMIRRKSDSSIDPASKYMITKIVDKKLESKNISIFDSIKRDLNK